MIRSSLLAAALCLVPISMDDVTQIAQLSVARAQTIHCLTDQMKLSAEEAEQCHPIWLREAAIGIITDTYFAIGCGVLMQSYAQPYARDTISKGNLTKDQFEKAKRKGDEHSKEPGACEQWRRDPLKLRSLRNAAAEATERAASQPKP
jgi:hypothetical protein